MRYATPDQLRLLAGYGFLPRVLIAKREADALLAKAAMEHQSFSESDLRSVGYRLHRLQIETIRREMTAASATNLRLPYDAEKRQTQILQEGWCHFRAWSLPNQCRWVLWRSIDGFLCKHVPRFLWAAVIIICSPVLLLGLVVFLVFALLAAFIGRKHEEYKPVA